MGAAWISMVLQGNPPSFGLGPTYTIEGSWALVTSIAPRVTYRVLHFTFPPSSHDRQQVNRATIGEGTIIIRSDPSQGLEGLNRDLKRAQELTKDSKTTVKVYVDPATIKEIAGGFEGVTDDFKKLYALVKAAFPDAAKSLESKLSYREKLIRDGHSPEDAERIITKLGPLVTFDSELAALADKYGGYDKIPSNELTDLFKSMRQATDVNLAANGDKIEVTLSPKNISNSQWYFYAGIMEKLSEDSGNVTLLLHDYVCAKAYELGDKSCKTEYDRFNKTINTAFYNIRKFIHDPIRGLVNLELGWEAQLDDGMKALQRGDSDEAMRSLGRLSADIAASVQTAIAAGKVVTVSADFAKSFNFTGKKGIVITGAEESAAALPGLQVDYGPMNPGPLDATTAKTFRSGTYSRIVTNCDTILYRVYGGSAVELGQFWTTTKPTGPLQAQFDFAINPEWGNTANHIVSVRIPAGQVIYKGVAAAEGGLPGGGVQVFVKRIDPAWIVK